MSASVIPSRRHVLAGGGALILSFSLRDAFAQNQAAPTPNPMFSQRPSRALLDGSNIAGLPPAR